MKKCPKCGSSEVEVVDKELGFIRCKKCGFSELEEYKDFSEERKSQREKGRYSPYRMVGGRRGKR